MKRYSVTHLTSAHPRYDTRIFLRECRSLSKVYDVNLIVADGAGDEIKDGIVLYDVGKPHNRWERIFSTTKAVYQKAMSLESDLYHFHDPELIFVGLKLLRDGKKVIFDVHEDTASQIQDKYYIPKPLRLILYFAYKQLNRYASGKFHLVLAEQSYVSIYQSFTKDYKVIYNFPDVAYLSPYRIEKRSGNGIFYIGGVSDERGLSITIEALKILQQKGIDFFMHYIGPIYDSGSIERLPLEGIERNIKFYGPLILDKGFEISKECKIGLSILQPIKNYTTSYSTKIFEYMSVGLPVITSNFPLYKRIIESKNSGFCVDPYNAKELAEKIAYLFTHESVATQMGSHGIKAVTSIYNWQEEEKKLLTYYKEILDA